MQSTPAPVRSQENYPGATEHGCCAVTDSDAVGAVEFNNAFVGMHYYGYLRRKPD